MNDSKTNNTYDEPPLTVYVQIPTAKNVPAIPNLPENTIAIPSKTSRFTFTHMEKELQISRKQACVEPSFSITAHKSQGQSLDKAYVQLEHCRYPQLLYVILSRVRTLDGIVLLGEFPEKLLNQQFPPALAAETRRLEDLERLLSPTNIPA
jgi:hypothetical protein